MSIISAMVKNIEHGEDPVQAIGTAVDQTVAWSQNIIAKAEASPVGQSVTTAVDEAKVLVADAGSWANTALGGLLSDYGDELAAVVNKYAQKIGQGNSPTTAALTAALGALVDVGKAVVAHETLGFQNAAIQALTPPAPPTSGG